MTHRLCAEDRQKETVALSLDAYQLQTAQCWSWCAQAKVYACSNGTSTFGVLLAWDLLTLVVLLWR